MTAIRCFALLGGLLFVIGAMPAGANHRPDAPRAMGAKHRWDAPRAMGLTPLARELRVATAVAYADAREVRPRTCRRQRRGLAALERLDRDARRFERALGRRGGDRRRTRAAFDELARSYDAAVRLHPRSVRRGDLWRVARLMDRIERRLSKRGRWHGWRDRRGHLRRDGHARGRAGSGGAPRWRVSWAFDF
ncbi:MAG: hypothetical protein VX546_11830 [Myxococcota bacterium]|nr:hypothetical protein [Myxococcota bacterium]